MLRSVITASLILPANASFQPEIDDNLQEDALYLIRAESPGSPTSRAGTDSNDEITTNDLLQSFVFGRNARPPDGQGSISKNPGRSALSDFVREHTSDWPAGEGPKKTSTHSTAANTTSEPRRAESQKGQESSGTPEI